MYTCYEQSNTKSSLHAQAAHATRTRDPIQCVYRTHTHKLHSLFSTFKRLTENIFLQMPTQTCGCVSNE